MIESFKYDPFGRRIYKSSPSITSVFVYDGDNPVEETNGAGAVVARYSQGLNIDEPLVMLQSGATSYYNADGLGSITSLSNVAGLLAQTYTFDSFGKQTTTSGSLTNLFEYTGRELDPETNLYYYRARYYDPSVGRFLGEDPLQFGADSVNFYEYAYDNPTNWTDPWGLQGLSPAGPTPSPMPPPAPPVEPPPVPSVRVPVAAGGAATAGAAATGAGAAGAATIGLIVLDVGLAICDAHQFYRLGVAYGWWGPGAHPAPQPARATSQKCDQDEDECDEQYARDKAYCSKNFWGTPLYGACRDRAFWRWSNCKRRLPSPGDLDPRKWK